MQDLAPLRPDDQCNYWSCTRSIRPFCSQAHQTLSEEGEQSPEPVIVVDGLNETYAKWASTKCVRGKILDQHTHHGLPILPLAVFETPPWLQPGVFNFDLRANEAVREWVFMAPPLPDERYGLYWKWYETKNQQNVRCSKFYWHRDAPVKLSGFFRITFYGLPENSVPAPQLAVYWLHYKPTVPGVRGEIIINVRETKAKKSSRGQGKPEASKQPEASKRSRIVPFTGTSSSNPLQLCERLPSPMEESAVDCAQLSTMPTVGGKVFDLAPEEYVLKVGGEGPAAQCMLRTRHPPIPYHYTRRGREEGKGLKED